MRAHVLLDDGVSSGCIGPALSAEYGSTGYDCKSCSFSAEERNMCFSAFSAEYSLFWCGGHESDSSPRRVYILFSLAESVRTRLSQIPLLVDDW